MGPLVQYFKIKLRQLIQSKTGNVRVNVTVRRVRVRTVVLEKQ